MRLLSKGGSKGSKTDHCPIHTAKRKMKTNSLREASIQTVFASLDGLLIMIGSLTTAVVMKANGFPGPGKVWHPLSLFVRDWGFLLILIPGLWAVGSVWMEKHPRFPFTRRWTMVTGILLSAGLAWLLVVAILLGSQAGAVVEIKADG